jgi:hypothetical protein
VVGGDGAGGVPNTLVLLLAGVANVLKVFVAGAANALEGAAPNCGGCGPKRLVFELLLVPPKTGVGVVP